MRKIPDDWYTENPYIPGTKYLIMALLAYHNYDDRTTEERYNLIMHAIYGQHAIEHKIYPPDKKIGQVHPYSWEEVCYMMYEAEKKKTYRIQLDLARQFVHLAPSRAGEESKPAILLKRYKAAKEQCKNIDDWRELRSKGFRNKIREMYKEDEVVIEHLKVFIGPLGWDSAFEVLEHNYDEVDFE